MPKEFDSVSVEITPVRRVKEIKITTAWDEHSDPPQTRVSVTFVYEKVFLDSDGKQKFPAQPDDTIDLDDATVRALPGFDEVYPLLSTAAHLVKDQREEAENPPPEDP